ncbi:hypothetical protein JTB14_014196 [Gonioctena quinquepunctata]|nr:hypothetical protein JTB14_014196 [Gonioctena quinquepunctata]
MVGLSLAERRKSFKYDEDYLTGVCDSSAKCCNCRGDHTANPVDCGVYVRKVAEIEKRLALQQPSPTASQTRYIPAPPPKLNRWNNQDEKGHQNGHEHQEEKNQQHGRCHLRGQGRDVRIQATPGSPPIPYTRTPISTQEPQFPDNVGFEGLFDKSNKIPKLIDTTIVQRALNE